MQNEKLTERNNCWGQNQVSLRRSFIIPQDNGRWRKVKEMLTREDWNELKMNNIRIISIPEHQAQSKNRKCHCWVVSKLESSWTCILHTLRVLDKRDLNKNILRSILIIIIKINRDRIFKATRSKKEVTCKGEFLR